MFEHGPGAKGDSGTPRFRTLPVNGLERRWLLGAPGGKLAGRMDDSLPPKLLFRAMKPGDDRRPICGPRGNELGVRPDRDIPVDEEGLVGPMSGGLSTTPDDLTKLPPHVRPEAFGGTGRLPLYVIRLSQLGSLVARPDPERPGKHVLIEPPRSMKLEELQSMLCATRLSWDDAKYE